MIRKLIPLAAIVAGAVAAPASAQMGPPPPPPGMGHEMMAYHRRMGQPSPEMEKAMAEHWAQIARDMHVVLRLRPDQEGAWKAFEAVMAPRVMEPPKGPSPTTTPARLDLMKRNADEMEARMGARDAAVRSFYAALSPEQQQVFDAVERMRGPGGRPMIARRMEMGGPPHD